MYSNKVSALSGRELDIYAKHIAALANRANNIVTHLPLACRGKILNSVMSLIERRADKVVHTGIQNGKFLSLTNLNIEHSCNEVTALANNRPARLKMNILTRSNNKILVDNLEIGLKICNRMACRVCIIHTNATAKIKILNLHTIIGKPLLKLQNATANSNKDAHIQNLGTNVEMKTNKLHILALCKKLLHSREHPRANAKLILLKSCADILVSMRINIGINSKSNLGNLSHTLSKIINNFNLRHRLAIKAEDACLKRSLNLLV